MLKAIIEFFGTRRPYDDYMRVEFRREYDYYKSIGEPITWVSIERQLLGR